MKSRSDAYVIKGHRHPAFADLESSVLLWGVRQRGGKTCAAHPCICAFAGVPWPKIPPVVTPRIAEGRGSGALRRSAFR